jgi:Glycosyl transferases group 1
LPAISCRLLYRSASPHLQQLYTGFRLLQRSGAVRLSQQRRLTPIRYENDAPHLNGAGHAHLDVLVERRLRLHFDTHDAQEIAVGELDGCDFYFKRSYLQAAVDSLPAAQRGKVLPLGMNYRVLPDISDFMSVRRALGISGFSRATLSALRQSFDASNRFGYQPRLRGMESEPQPNAAPNVLFLVAAYDPYDDPMRTQDKIDDRISINETRARCIRLLREALGPRFTGGFGNSAFTQQHYSDLVWAEPVAQQNYLRTLSAFPICVATTGLHGSTGWKFAEYVAFSKAILSEPLVYEVTGNFRSGKHYLEFASPEECVHAAIRLIEEPELRRQMMRDNATYYREYLRPDALVKNALMRALATKQ